MTNIFIVLSIGIVAQYVDGALGMGYGASSSAFLLAAGLMPAVVSASVHVGKIFSGISSGVAHLKFGNVDRRLTLWLTAGGCVGGVTGVFVLYSISGDLLKPFVAALLLALGLRIFLKFLFSRRRSEDSGKFSGRFVVVLGFIGGIVDAIGGGGWGPVCTSTLVSSDKVEPRLAVGSVNLAEVFMSIAVVVTFLGFSGTRDLLWPIILPLIAGGVIAAPLAAYTAKKLPRNVLGAGIGIVLITLNVTTIAKSFEAVSWMKEVDPVIFHVFFLVLILGVIVAAKCATEKKT